MTEISVFSGMHELWGLISNAENVPLCLIHCIRFSENISVKVKFARRKNTYLRKIINSLDW